MHKLFYDKKKVSRKVIDKAKVYMSLYYDAKRKEGSISFKIK